MASTEEIQRRVEEADTARSAKRSAAAQQVGELAQRRAAVAEQLDDIERQLGDVLAAAQDVIGIDELARFTDLPASDLTRWFEGRKTNRSKRKRSTTRAATKKEPSKGSSPRTATANRAPTTSEPAPPRSNTTETPVEVAAAAR